MDMKRSFMIRALLILVFVTIPGNILPQEKQSYETLVERIKSGDQLVDFRALRIAFTETPLYQPYGGDRESRQAMFEALRGKQFEKAIEHATAVLEKNYVDIDAHVVCRVAYREMKHMEKDREHQFIMKGLIDFILNSGDGITPETAYVVINTREEYIILNVLGFKPEKQSTVESNGKKYDRMEAVDLKTNQKVEIYFNIDLNLITG